MSLGILFAAVFVLFQQNPPGATSARAEGTVINQVTREPVDRVEILFELERGASRKVSTDAEGKFAIRDLPAGRYQIKLTRSGFADAPLNSGPRHLSLQPDSELKGIRMEVVATTAISGRVLDQNQRPIESAFVHALKVHYVNGRRILSPGAWASFAVYSPFRDWGPDGPPLDPRVFPPQVKTDARGEYRLFGLPPGEYYLSIWSKSHKPEWDGPPVYYPGVNDPSTAIPIVVRGGSPEMTGMNIQIPEAQGYTAQVRIIPPTGEGYDCSLGLSRLANVVWKAFTLVQHSANLDVVHFSGPDYTSGDKVAHIRIQKTEEDLWKTSKLPPGSYKLFHSSCPDASGLSANLSFTLTDRDIDLGTLTVPRSAPIPGRFRNPAGLTVDWSSVLIRLRPTDWRGLYPGSTPNDLPGGHNRVNPDGTFAFQWEWNVSKGQVFGRVAPGHFMVDVAGLPPDVYVSSIKYGAKEVRDSGMDVDSNPPGEIEITLASPGATVSGTVRNSKDQRVPDSPVVLVPQAGLDAPVIFSRTGATDQDGTFAIRGVPPGVYWALSAEGIDTNAFDNPEFFRQYQTRATRVILENATTVDLNLRVIAR